MEPTAVGSTFAALSPDRNGIGPDSVKIEFSKRFNRAIDGEFEKSVSGTWADRLKLNPGLFDGTKFRLHAYEKLEDGQDAADGPMVLFRMGLTSYKEYLGTNCSDNCEELAQLGLNRHQNRQAYMADPLGVGVFLITADNRFVFLRRSQACAEAQGYLDGPGGHAEPDMVSGLSDEPLSVQVERSIALELFDSILREIVDEANIPKDCLSEARLLGITENWSTSNRKSAEFIVKCKLTSDEVRKLFEEGTQTEAEESTEIVFFTEDELLSAPTSDPKLWLDLAPASRGRVLLYKNLKSV